MTIRHRQIIVKLLEAAALLLLFTAFIHLLTCDSVHLLNMVFSAAIVLVALVVCRGFLAARSQSSCRLWAVSAALAAGFWFFSYLRYIGLVQWPLSHPANLTRYVSLFGFHLILAVAVLAPILLAARLTNLSTVISWGNWTERLWRSPAKIVLLLCAIACWLWALYVVLTDKLDLGGPLYGFIGLCLVKALLTGVTEEICYRGIIQPAAVARFGVTFGILFQSCLYAAFHMHLGPAFFTRIYFLAATMTLGILFGLITHFTRGIGWVSIVHIAISVVIEWRNLS